jgi:F-type H+-transporting ATPase subunit epsilon
MSTIHVDIVSAEGAIYSGEATMVFASAREGDVGIAPRHAPLLTDLRPGDVRVQLPDSPMKNFISSCRVDR